MEPIVQLNSNAKLSEHFSLGEFTKSNSHPEIYNIPSHEAIANLKRLCTWLEELRKRYNDKYVAPQPLSPCHLDQAPLPPCHLDQAQRVERSHKCALGRKRQAAKIPRLRSE